MKISVEPKRMQELIERCLIGENLPNTKLIVNENEITIADQSTDSIGVKGYFKKEFFIDYEIDDDEEELYLNSNVLKLIKAFKDEKIDIETSVNDKKENVLTLTGKESDAEEVMQDHELSDLPAEPIIDKDRGFLFDKNAENIVLSIRLKKTNLSLPVIGETKIYKLTCDSKEVYIRLKDTGTKFNRKLTPDKTSAIKEFKFNIEASSFNLLVSLMPEEFWLTINKNGGITFSTKQTDYALSYFMVDSGED